MIHIDENVLLKLAGAREFGLGVYYFEDDRVGDVKSTQDTTTAVVRGSRRHNVQLWHPQHRVEGACDCEVSGDIDFCRHCVALGLALLERETATTKIDKRASMRRIEVYFRQKTPDELTAELMDLAGQHRIIRDELLQKAQFAVERLSYGQMKKMLDDAPPVDDWWDFPQVRRYFKVFDSILARITEYTGTWHRPSSG